MPHSEVTDFYETFERVNEFLSRSHVAENSEAKFEMKIRITAGSKKKVKGHFIGLFQHCGRSAYCILTLNKFPHSSPEAPRIMRMRETSTSEGGNYYQIRNLRKSTRFFYMPQRWDMGHIILLPLRRKAY